LIAFSVGDCRRRVPQPLSLFQCQQLLPPLLLKLPPLQVPKHRQQGRKLCRHSLQQLKEEEEEGWSSVFKLSPGLSPRVESYLLKTYLLDRVSNGFLPLESGKVNRQPSMMSVQDKQLLALEKRQKLFKEAALQVIFCGLCSCVYHCFATGSAWIRIQTLVLDPGLGAKIFTKLTNLLCFTKKSSVVVTIEVRNLFYFFIVKGIH
jgi:hypothetical protein